LAENVNLDDEKNPTLLPQHILVQHAFEFPAAYAQAFHDNIELFFSHIVGFDKDRNAPRTGGGIFGIPKGYTSCVESNGRYILHLHAMLYLFGCYRTQAEQDKLLNNPDFQLHFQRHVDSVVRAFIGEPNFVQTPCTNCNASNTMKADPLPVDAAHKQNKFQFPPVTMHCEGCGTGHNTDKRWQSFLRTFRDRHPDIMFPADTEVFLKDCGPNPGDWPGDTPLLNPIKERERVLALYRIMLLQNKLAVHLWRHNNTCFKKGASCRMRYPKKLVELLAFFRLVPTIPCGCEHCIKHHVDTEAACSCCTCDAVIPDEQNSHEVTSTTGEPTKTCTCDACTEPDGHDLTSHRYDLFRPIGNEFTVSHVRAILHVYGCNNDVQLLASLKQIYYQTKYSTKPQNNIESLRDLAIVALARKRAREIENPANHSLTQQALSRIASMAYYDTSCRLEIGAPMVNLYLRNPTAQLPFAYNSHTFTFVMLTQILRLLSGQEWTATVMSRRKRPGDDPSATGPAKIDAIACVPQIVDYFFRDDRDESECLYLFFECFLQRLSNNSGEARANTHDRDAKRKKNNDKQPRKRTTVSDFFDNAAEEDNDNAETTDKPEKSMERAYQPRHPKAHCNHYRRIDRRKSTTFFAPRIVTLVGPRLPDQRKLHLSKQLRDLYGRIALSLFDHYRSFADLLLIDRNNPDGAKFEETETESAYWLAWSARKEAICNAEPVIPAILEHLQDYHDGQRDAINTQSVPAEGDDTGGNVRSTSRRHVSDATEEECYNDYAEMCLLAAIDDCDGNTTPLGRKLGAGQDPKWEKAMQASTERTVLTTQQFSLWPMSDTYSTLPMSLKKNKAWSFDPTNVAPSIQAAVGPMPARGIQCELLPETWLEYKRDTFPVQPAEFRLPTAADAAAGVGSSIREISELFGHDEEQWRGYATPTTSLLETHRVRQLNNDASVAVVLPSPKQLCMQIVGPAGAGKSSIIHATLYTATRLGIRDSILTVSPGGGAALSINGMTLDSFTWPMKGYRPLKKELQKLREKWAALIMIFLDEVSFVKHMDLWLLDARLRQIMGKDLPFGGLHVVLFGDFLQVQRPLSSPSLYAPLSL
jgi:hypothetical protein